MALISCDATFLIKDLIDVGRSLPPHSPLFAHSEACPPFLLSPSSFGYERRETSAAPLPRRNLDLPAFAFVTYNHRVHERRTMALSDWMAPKKKKKKKRHSAVQNKRPSCFPPLFLPPSSSHCHTRLATLGGSLPC